MKKDVLEQIERILLPASIEEIEFLKVCSYSNDRINLPIMNKLETNLMDKKKQKRIINQVKQDRAARRKIALELDIPQEKSKIHKTSKKDIMQKEKNTLKSWEI